MTPRGLDRMGDVVPSERQVLSVGSRLSSSHGTAPSLRAPVRAQRRQHTCTLRPCGRIAVDGPVSLLGAASRMRGTLHDEVANASRESQWSNVGLRREAPAFGAGWSATSRISTRPETHAGRAWKEIRQPEYAALLR